MPQESRRRLLKLGLIGAVAILVGGAWKYISNIMGISYQAELPREEEQKPPQTDAPFAGQGARDFQDPINGSSDAVENGIREGKAENDVKAEDDADDRSDPGEKGWKRPLGKTGFMVSLFGLGGAGVIAAPGKKDEAIYIINRALDLGVNYIDTAPSYADGVSESHIGEVMKERRSEVFLASKTLERSYDGTMRLIEKSLRRLQTDYLDLLQVHGIRDRDDAMAALKDDGAVRALEGLKKQGVIKYTGVTGHRQPAALLYAMEAFDFDCVLMPLNPADVHSRSFKDELLASAADEGVGIIAMKVASYGRLFRSEGIASMEQALGYVLSLPVSTAIVGISSIEQLEENIDIAKNFSTFPADKMEYLEALTAPYQAEANFFKDW